MLGDYESFIHKSRYAKYIPEENRRETWTETCKRWETYWGGKFTKLGNDIYKAFDAMHKQEVMPSMRSLMTAGTALDRDHVAGYNCSYLPIDDLRCFDEMMYILMCGTGVGFSAEAENVNKLPVVGKFNSPWDYTYFPGVDKEDLSFVVDEYTTHAHHKKVVVADTKYGWASALRLVIGLKYQGHYVTWDTSRVRAAGEPLKTFGGRASGPEPLEELFKFVVQTIHDAEHRRLTDVEVHDICCKIAEVVVVGGVRRSALISLTDLESREMAHAKKGEWWKEQPQRALANNSAVYNEKPPAIAFLKEWTALVGSGSGERGIFSRQASKVVAERNGRRNINYAFGSNPCCEIILRPFQFCNLTEVVVRPGDTQEDLLRKIENATFMGTLQATLTSFKYLRPIWRENTEEEALLGVSLTGIMDHPILCGGYGAEVLHHWLVALKEKAVEVNKHWAEFLGINQAAAITCVKPSGTVSQLVGSSSGIHPSYAPYYIRRVRADKKDPLGQFMKDAGYPCEDEYLKPDTTEVFSFPICAPGTITADDRSAIQQLQHWLMYARHWCEHKPSVTIYVRDDEWLEVGAWVYDHFEEMSGVSFLPYNEHTFQQAPYEAITEKEYFNLRSKMPQDVDWDGFREVKDSTTGNQTLACSAGSCDIADLL